MLGAQFGCKAVLLDLDGVLVDSTAVVVRIWSGWAERRGIEAERRMEIAHGRRSAETIALIAPHLDAGVSGISGPINVLAASLAIRGRRHTYRRMTMGRS